MLTLFIPLIKKKYTQIRIEIPYSDVTFNFDLRQLSWSLFQAV